MNLRQLEFFVAVVDNGSFTRGAESALRTQSTVSQQIAALENELGVRLLDRTGRGVELTEGGKLFLAHARRALAELGDLERGMAHFKSGEEVTLTVGASNVPATYLIPRLLPELQRRHPGITLHLISDGSRATLVRLAAGEIELAVVGSRFDAGEIDFTPLTADVLVLVVGSRHRWRQNAGITLAELREEPLVLRESGSGSDRELGDALATSGLASEQLRVAARLGSNEAVKEAVAAGCGVAFLSEISIRREVERGELFTVPVEGLSVTRSLWLALRSERTRSPAAELFTGLLREMCVGPA